MSIRNAALATRPDYDSQGEEHESSLIPTNPFRISADYRSLNSARVTGRLVPSACLAVIFW